MISRNFTSATVLLRTPSASTGPAVVTELARVRRSTLYPCLVGSVTAESFETEVLSSPVPVIVDFWAPWCKPCKAIERHLESLAAEWGERVRLVRVDVDAEAGIAARYGVLSLPTVILFAKGETKATVYGAQPRERFAREFSPHL